MGKSDELLTLQPATRSVPERQPHVGELVQVRSRRWLVDEVIEPKILGQTLLIRLSCADDDAQGQALEVLWDYELDRFILEEEGWAADMSLARSENSPQRFYSLASQIRRERPEYYESLERTQKGDLDITARLAWFIECFSRALDAAEVACAGVLRKADFWQRQALAPLNERQRKVLNRYLDGFEGKLTAPKWAAIAKCSMPTAQRDIKELVDRHLLVRNEGGSKNTSYSIASSQAADTTPMLPVQ